MPFSADQITPEEDRRRAPAPDRDAHWWRVDLGEGRRVGWVWIAGGVPVPSEEWIAAELTRQEPLLGHALEGQLVSSGFHLSMAPRPDHG